MDSKVATRFTLTILFYQNRPRRIKRFHKNYATLILPVSLGKSSPLRDTVSTRRVSIYTPSPQSLTHSSTSRAGSCGDSVQGGCGLPTKILIMTRSVSSTSTQVTTRNSKVSPASR